MSGERGTVLVVDDSAFVRKKVTEALAGAGFGAVEAADGVEALAVLARHEVVLVITDFLMPKMSGSELISAIREHEPWAQLPVIVLSTVGNGGVVEPGWERGVTVWLRKPYKPELLVAAALSLVASPLPVS
ncbi:MAG: response regulator [Polyangiaceae bacterium]|nr:response regulator [Polyangiaceae bacterium]